MSLNSSSNSSPHPPFHECRNFSACTSIFTAFFISYILLLLPLFIFVLYVGYQRRRKQRSVATTATASHSDIFTFNMAVLEILSILGFCYFCYGAYTDQLSEMIMGINIFSIISPGQNLFHVLTCVDRYLAVVRPVTYLGLRQAGGVRIRNISIGCVWLLSFGSMGLSMCINYFYIIYNFVFLAISLIVVSFCNISVLCVLIRPGPGEVGGNRERVDQSKQRAFHTMMAITGALLLRLLCSLVSSVIYNASMLNFCEICLALWSTGWFYLPSSLVLPLLFLHRAGKLPGCKHNTQSG